jgi:hypothetical protein
MPQPQRYYGQNHLPYLTTSTYRRSPVLVSGRGQAGGSISCRTPRSSRWIGCHEAKQERPAPRDGRHGKASISATRGCNAACPLQPVPTPHRKFLIRTTSLDWVPRASGNCPVARGAIPERGYGSCQSMETISCVPMSLSSSGESSGVRAIQRPPKTPVMWNPFRLATCSTLRSLMSTRSTPTF